MLREGGLIDSIYRDYHAAVGGGGGSLTVSTEITMLQGGSLTLSTEFTMLRRAH